MLSIAVNNQRQNKQIEHPSGVFEFGRVAAQGDVPRFVVEDSFVSRDHLQVEELPGGRIRLKNLSARNPILFADGTELAATESLERFLPIRVTVGETSIAIELKGEPKPAPRAAGPRPMSLSSMPTAPLSSAGAAGGESPFGMPVRFDAPPGAQQPAAQAPGWFETPASPSDAPAPAWEAPASAPPQQQPAVPSWNEPVVSPAQAQPPAWYEAPASASPPAPPKVDSPPSAPAVPSWAAQAKVDWQSPPLGNLDLQESAAADDRAMVDWQAEEEFVEATTVDLPPNAPPKPTIAPAPKVEVPPVPPKAKEVSPPEAPAPKPTSAKKKERAPEPPAPAPAGDAPTPEVIGQWMESVLELQRTEAEPQELYAKIAHAMVTMLGLDIALVMIHGPEGWQLAARGAHDEDAGPPSGRTEYNLSILEHIATEKQAFYQGLAVLPSPKGIKSVFSLLAAAAFGPQHEVVGALYGLRLEDNQKKAHKSLPLESQLLQLLATAVSTSVLRGIALRPAPQAEPLAPAEPMPTEPPAERAPEPVPEHEPAPETLEILGQDVTVLRSSLRGLSTWLERLAPADSERLIPDLLEKMAEVILNHGGAIVSSDGEALVAVWNVSAQQENHAELACRAAWTMLESLPALNAVWEPIAGQVLGIGIGIHTGPSRVGVTNRTRRILFGPVGHVPNVASRVEGATNALKLPLLITGSTRAHLHSGFSMRRLGQVRVNGMQNPVELFELQSESAPADWHAYRDAYEEALAHYEARRWAKTYRILLPLLEQTEESGLHDPATLNLLTHARKCLENPPEVFDPAIWKE